MKVGKIIGRLMVGCSFIGCLVGTLHAQIAPFGIANNNLAPVEAAPADFIDSIVQLTADYNGLQLLQAGQTPMAGTFWTVIAGPGSMALPYPCPPPGINLPTYEISQGIYLVDDTASTNPVTQADLEAQATATVNVIGLVQTAAANQQMQTMSGAMGLPFPGGGGGGGSPALTNAPYVAPNYGTNLWLQITSLSNVWVNLMVSNTVADVEYQILGATNLLESPWASEGFLYGSETTNWTPTSIAAFNPTNNNLFLRVMSWLDSDNIGIPDWWQQEYFGYVGVNPNAQDSAGDGWTIYQKYELGVPPNVFYTPPAPQNLVATYNRNTGAETVTWSPSPGAVTSYTLSILNGDTAQTTDITLSATNTSFTTNMAAGTPYYGNAFYGPQINVILGVAANYGTNGSSPASSQYAEGDIAPSAQLVYAADGRLCCAFQGLPNDVGAVRIYRQRSSSEVLDYSSVDGPYAEDDLMYTIAGSPIADGYFEMPSTSIFNGVCELPDSQVPPYFAYNLWVQTIRSNGVASAWTTLNAIDYGTYSASRPFLDARRQLKDNLIFLLRAADQSRPFAFTVNEVGEGWYLPPEFTWPNGYVYADFYNYVDGVAFAVDELMPLHQNYFYRNFLFDPNKLAADGFLNTGCYETDPVLINSYPSYYFDAAAFITATNPPVPPSQLTPGLSRWILPGDAAVSYLDGSTFASGQQNYYGLPWVSEEIAWLTNDQTVVQTFYPNDTFPNGVGGVTYNEMAQPEFQLAGYNFARPGTDPMPEENDYSPTGTQPTMIVGLGNSLTVAGFADLALSNGNSGVSAYLGQYFSGAYQINSNGVVTTNSAGILSPYGAFSPTVPGPAALVTMPDIDPPYQQGTCTVYAISLQVDKLHDTNMINTSFNSPDATSLADPMVFWCDNNYDRYVVDPDDNVPYDDDVAPNTQAALGLNTPRVSTPDCNYLDSTGQRIIPCARDLQDFTRLWVCGVTSNLLAALPAGSTVTLNWGDMGSPNSGNPTIDLFTAADSDGGIGYLTNSATADIQFNSLFCPYIGRVGPGSNLVLNAASFANHWAGNHFIWCGVGNGTGGLNLTIADANGNVLAQTTAYIQIVDIKQMYERWSVGDNLSVPPTNTPYMATEGLPVGVPAFQYPPPTDTNTPYILYVHGWNMDSYDKDRFAEAAFKRLYWQGYHGRFGLPRRG